MVTAFTDVIRGLPDEALAALLRARPDLVVPVPADLSALAARAQSRSSVARVLDQLDRFQLEILDAIRLVRDEDEVASLDQLLAVTTATPSGPDAATVRAALRTLRDRLVVYGSDQLLQVVAAADELLGPYPAGLGRPAAELDPRVAALVADPARLRRTVLAAPPAARAVLERLAAGPPVGSTSADADPDSPVSWLVEHHLLVATSAGAVELPREIGVLLRRDTGPLGPLHPTPPQPTGTSDPAQIDQAGAGQAMTVVQRTEALLAALAAEPAPLLRSGGLGVRELRRLARATGVDEPTAALLIEVGYGAGLLGTLEPTRPGEEPTLTPTSGYDTWLAAGLATRWHTLAAAWLSLTREPGLVGQRDSRDRLINALSPEVVRSSAPVVRRSVLRILAGLPAGTCPSEAEVLELVAWHAPRWLQAAATGGRLAQADRERMVRRVLAEAASLGLTGRDGMTGYGARLLAEVEQPVTLDDDPLGIHAGDEGGGPASTAALAALLPEPVGELLIQADLTVVVPGPPEPTLAAELELVAEPESAGGAAVHRVTRDSLRRALDAGYSAEDLHGLFRRRCRSRVPQALTYLIDDVARSHGGLRVGSAHSYLRSQDEALLTQVLADRRLASLGIRRLAPTVLISGAGQGRLLAALRQAGYAPVPEDATGATVLVRPRTRRAPTPGRQAVADPTAAARMSNARLRGIIEDLRRAEAITRAARRGPAGRSHGEVTKLDQQSHIEAMAVLQQAVRDRSLVWVGYVDSHGGRTWRLVRPVSIGAGYLRAEDERTDTWHTFALHRITGASLEV